MYRTSAPFYVQFEVTEMCNHSCFFCYNNATELIGEQLSYNEIKNILQQLKEVGVFSINFNGGEPLIRSDIFDILEFASNLNFDLHMNTNATLIDDYKADQIAKFLHSVCVSVLASEPKKHDFITGQIGSFKRMKEGVSLLLERGVKVEVNVCTFRSNYNDLYNIAKIMAENNVHVFCVTRYILSNPKNIDKTIGVKETLEVLETLDNIKKEFPTYKEVKLPGPVPFCELPSDKKETLKEWNIPCQIGYGLCRISPQGIVTPCPISSFYIGNLREYSFKTLWNNEKWHKYNELLHLPKACKTCDELYLCRGGCIGYDDCLVENGYTPDTYKWRGDKCMTLQ